jgi:hypothetical protein
MQTKIKNLFDYEQRNLDFKKFKFISDYKSGYAPIEIQEKSEKEFQK